MDPEDTNIFGEIRLSPPHPKSDKVTLPWPNVANQIGDWFAKEWPELQQVPYLWVTGSSVWRFLYGEPAKPGADLDVFITPHKAPERPWIREYTGAPRQELFDCLARIRGALKPLLVEPPNTTATMVTSLGGEIAYTSKGRVDYWQSCSGVHEQLGNYPIESHGHCKAAYSPFWKSLVVARNPLRTIQGELELAERQMLGMPDNMDRLQALCR